MVLLTIFYKKKLIFLSILTIKPSKNHDDSKLKLKKRFLLIAVNLLNNDWQFEALVPVFSFDKFAEILQFLSYILIQLFKANWLSDWTYWCCRERWWGGEGRSNGWGPSRRPPEPWRRASPRSGPNEPLWWSFRRRSSWKKIIWRQKNYLATTDEKELTRDNESSSVKLVRLEENTSDVMRIQF